MNFEHVALNVAEPVAMAAWYNKHLGLDIVRSMSVPPYTHFLRDSGGRMLLEIYNNPPDDVPVYSAMDSLLLHLAFVSEDPGADSRRLIEAGAAFEKEDRLADGSYLVMIRDPWGLCIQLCRRGQKFS